MINLLVFQEFNHRIVIQFNEMFLKTHFEG